MAFCAALPLTLWAQLDSRFAGRWEMNVSKSTFSPYPVKTQTVTIRDGQTVIEGAMADGTSFKRSFRPVEGKPVAIEGVKNSTVICKSLGNTIDDHWNMYGRAAVLHGHGVLSEDGKTLKYTLTGTNTQGQPVHDVYVFEKQ